MSKDKQTKMNYYFIQIDNCINILDRLYAGLKLSLSTFYSGKIQGSDLLETVIYVGAAAGMPVLKIKNLNMRTTL